MRLVSASACFGGVSASVPANRHQMFGVVVFVASRNLSNCWSQKSSIHWQFTTPLSWFFLLLWFNISSFCLSISLFSRFYPFIGCLPLRPLDSHTHTSTLVYCLPFVLSPIFIRTEYVSIFSASQTYFIPCRLAVRGFLLFGWLLLLCWDCCFCFCFIFFFCLSLAHIGVFELLIIHCTIPTNFSNFCQRDTKMSILLNRFRQIGLAK